jgi:hypothetical protein
MMEVGRISPPAWREASWGAARAVVKRVKRVAVSILVVLSGLCV